MAKFELNIYGEDDEILKKHETNIVRTGVFLAALKLHEETKDKSPEDQFFAACSLIKKLFVGLTDEEIENADFFDIMNTFEQVISAANGLNSSKNA